jgi:hypothetical protein
VPVRTTLSRRYKALYPVLQAFIAYLGQWAEKLSPEFDSQVLMEPTFRTLWVEKVTILDGFSEQTQYLYVDRAQVD